MGGEGQRTFAEELSWRVSGDDGATRDEDDEKPNGTHPARKAGLASLVLRHLVRRVLLALLAESLLRFGNVHLGWKREDGGGGRKKRMKL